MSTQAHALAGVRVMLVDDDLDTLELLAMILTLSGAVTATRTTAQAVLDDLVNFAPHVLMSDIDMPRMNGHELMRRIRQRPTHLGGAVQSIAVTADGSQRARALARESGFGRLIQKPIDVAHVIGTIQELAHPAGAGGSRS
ncbi:Two-component hybrid sensor and regulator [Enhygromyxa salina]|uniref:Two-component hybrid sensor and regulator n=1 Tax=Enhygromyxa salina TaxID=215803 RepID=A0A0C2A4N2_9BACT|nr:response regulator [Enhygromyxa salina]KIG18343.1 Two-component hybrid sensor and regulator [Enhygromyxa salina]